MYRFGIIGIGSNARHYLAAAAKHPDIEIVYLADPDESRVQALAQEFDVPAGGRKLSTAVTNRGIDATIIDLPTHRRKNWVLRAVKSLKDVLCTQPLCRTYREAREVMAMADKCAADVLSGSERRYSPARIKAREIILAGELGSPLTWHVSAMGAIDGPSDRPEDWMWDDQRGGGRIMDDSIHDFDFACWVLGTPVEVYAQSNAWSPTVSAPAQASAVVRFAEGDSLLYGAAWQEADLGAAPGPNAVIGPLGALVFESDYAIKWHRTDGQVLLIEVKKDELKPGGLGASWLFYRQLDDFIANLRTAQPSTAYCTPEQALESIFIADTITGAGPEGVLAKYKGPRR